MKTRKVTPEMEIIHGALMEARMRGFVGLSQALLALLAKADEEANGVRAARDRAFESEMIEKPACTEEK